MYIDSNGLIVQKDMDGGDSAQRMGFYYSALAFKALLGLPSGEIPSNLASFDKALELLMTSEGLIRNPIVWNDPKDCSRDQTRPIMIASGLNKRLDIVERLKTKTILGLYPNKDIASPENWNEYRRAMNRKPTFLGDLWSYLGVILHCHKVSKNLDDVGDDLNCLLTCTYFYLVNPTFISREALRYYLKHRPINYGNTKLMWSDPVIGALEWYFRPDSGGNPELAEIWSSIIIELRDRLGV